MPLVRAAAFLASGVLGLQSTKGADLAMGLVIAALQEGRPRPGRLTVVRLKLAALCDPSLAETWEFLAKALIDRGRKQEASTVLLRGLESSRLGYSNFERFAELFGQCGKDQLRRFCLLASAMEAPHRPDPWSLLGDSYLKRGLYNAAHECFLKATRVPKDLMADHRAPIDSADVRDLGRVQYLLGQDETALRTIERAQKMDSSDIRTLTYLAQCHRRLGHQEEFESVVEQLRARRDAEVDDCDEDDDEEFDWEQEIFGLELVQAQRRAALAKLIDESSQDQGGPQT